ncbi:MAG: HD domain-containing protein [Bacilli bacterium]|nr:HD domain-containing protein [Bacilli bacterium]
MKKKTNIRFPIRAKISIMTMVTIAIAVVSLGIFLLMTFANSAYDTASSTLNSVSTNATLALQNSISSAETSMKLLANQIGYNHDFANNIVTVSTSSESESKIKTALNGSDQSGDGSTLIGAMDYLVVSDPDIESATMYSPFVTNPIYNRLKPTSMSNVEFTEEKYQKLIEHPGKSNWYFIGEQLFVWKALVNFGVEDSLDMQVVGYIEYEFNRPLFLSAITDTQYENEGMLLFDENGDNVLNLSSGDKSVDNAVLNNVSKFSTGVSRADSYTVAVNEITSENWKYVSFINHESIKATIGYGRNLTIVIVGVSVIAAAVVAFLLSSAEIKRIKNLSKAASSISGGDYNTRVDLKANDEITDVSSSFNTMAGKIQDVLNELILQQDSISENFATILSNKSGESGNHVKRVSEYSAILAQELGFNESEVHDIRIASMLHDVGKIMVDENILHKPGRFTDEEYKIMQQHVVYGGQLLKGVPGNIMQLGAIIAEYHHERYDGNGYVHHLVGDEIPKEAQITSVADVFDALVSKRCYKGAWTIDDAYNEIVSQKGKQFAPDVVDAFIRRFEDFKHISEIYKENE